jgi:glutamyl-tRNA reductase
MERLVNSVLQSAKAIKTHTQLSGGSVSVSFAAVKWIKQQVQDIAEKKILLLGTGKIGRNTCQNMIDYLGTRNITLINRTDSRSEQLAAELAVKSSPIAEAETEIARADIIVACTNANEAIIHSHHLEGNGPKLIIDLSVPCSLTTEAAALPGITLVNVDMLSKIKDETLEMRRMEVPKAEAIIEEHVKEFRQWCDMRKYVVVLKKVKNKLTDIHTSAAAISINIPVPGQKEKEQIQAVINLMAVKMRTQHTPGCHYIEAINDYMACYG